MSSSTKLNITYATVHTLVCNQAPTLQSFRPDYILAIGGGGFVPARILRNYLKVPVLAVTLKLYDGEQTGERVEIVQWLDADTIAKLKGKRVLIVDEVDDTRATLLMCIALVKKTTQVAAIGTFVLYNKVNKEKAGTMPDDVTSFVGVQIGNVWVNFPWETMPAKCVKPSPSKVWVVFFTIHEDGYKRRYGDEYEGPFVFENSFDANACVKERKKAWLRGLDFIDEAKNKRIQEDLEENWETVFENENKGEYVDALLECRVANVVVQLTHGG